MSQSKRTQHPKRQSSKGRGMKRYRAFFKRHLATLDLIATSLVAIIFIPLATLYVITVFSSYSEEVSNSAVAPATPVVSAAPVQAPTLPSNEQEQQLTPLQTNNIPPAVPNQTAPIANVSDSARPVDNKGEIVSHTPDFIEEQVLANHPFDAASAVSQAQAVGQSSSGGVSPTDFGFTGQRQESFGLLDYGGRYYNPVTGRFISADPLIPNPGNPQDLNRYSYVRNNPVRYTDSTGHCTEWEGRADGLCTRATDDGSFRVVHGGSVFVNDVEKNYANALLSGNPDYMNQISPDTPGMFLAQSFQNVETQLGYRAEGMPIDPYVAIGMSAPFGSLVEDGISSGSQMPLGFRNTDEFQQFGSNLYTSLKNAGINDATAIFQGSSVTGKKFTTGQAFDIGRVSDFDIGLASPTLLQRAGELGIGLRSGGTRTGPLKALEVEQLGLTGLRQQLSEQAGRPVNFMIYNSVETAINRGPSIVIQP